MFLPIVLYGALGGIREAYGLGLGNESLSGSPSSVIYDVGKSLRGLRVWRAGEDRGGVPSVLLSRVGAN